MRCHGNYADVAVTPVKYRSYSLFKVITVITGYFESLQKFRMILSNPDKFRVIGDSGNYRNHKQFWVITKNTCTFQYYGNYW